MVAVLSLCGCGDGGDHYVLHNGEYSHTASALMSWTNKTVFKIDTKTGKTWILGQTNISADDEWIEISTAKTGN